MVAYECVAGRGSRNDPQVWKGMVRRRDIYDEVLKQGGLFMRLYYDPMPVLDDQSIAALRRLS